MNKKDTYTCFDYCHWYKVFWVITLKLYFTPCCATSCETCCNCLLYYSTNENDSTFQRYLLFQFKFNFILFLVIRLLQKIRFFIFYISFFSSKFFSETSYSILLYWINQFRRLRRATRNNNNNFFYNYYNITINQMMLFAQTWKEWRHAKMIISCFIVLFNIHCCDHSSFAFYLSSNSSINLGWYCTIIARTCSYLCF